MRSRSCLRLANASAAAAAFRQMSSGRQLYSSGRGALLCVALAMALVASLAAQAGAAVYWVNGNSIGRMNLDGTNPSPGLIFSYSSPMVSPCGLAVNGTHLFWADQGRQRDRPIEPGGQGPVFTHSSTWRSWIRIRPAVKGRAARRLHMRLERDGQGADQASDPVQRRGQRNEQKGQTACLAPTNGPFAA